MRATAPEPTSAANATSAAAAPVDYRGTGRGVRVQSMRKLCTPGPAGRPLEQTPSEQCGDILLRDRDGNWTYQFAVTVDDFRHGVTW
jgi:hypothetical protein